MILIMCFFRFIWFIFLFLTESSEMLRLTSSSGCSMSPSPPLSAAAPPAGRRITQIRTRRLRPHYADISKPRPSEETPGPDLRNLCPQSIMTVSSQTVSPQIFHKPHRPSASPAVSRLRAQRYIPVIPFKLHICVNYFFDKGISDYNIFFQFRSEDTRNHQYSDIQHKPITLSNTVTKLTPGRPQTANAALQRLPERNLLPARRNSHLEWWIVGQIRSYIFSLQVYRVSETLKSAEVVTYITESLGGAISIMINACFSLLHFRCIPC